MSDDIWYTYNVKTNTFTEWDVDSREGREYSGDDVDLPIEELEARLVELLEDHTQWERDDVYVFNDHEDYSVPALHREGLHLWIDRDRVLNVSAGDNGAVCQLWNYDIKMHMDECYKQLEKENVRSVLNYVREL